MNFRKKFEILTYNIGFIQKDVDEVIQNGIRKSDIVWMRHPYKDRFFADPFLIESDEQYLYILCEEYIFWERKGKIALLTVRKEDYSLQEKCIIIEEKTHLSFPYCKYHGRIVCPESSASGKYYAYEISLEDRKVINKTLLLDEGTVDGVFCERNNEVYLLTGKTKMSSTDLYLYKKGATGAFISCCDNKPVLSDNGKARSAGNLFMWNNKLLRPVQDCRKRYGHQTKIMEILKMDESGYLAEEICTLNSFNNPPFNETMHTFNAYQGMIIVDGSKDKLRFPMKFFYRKCQWLFKKSSE